MTRFRREATVVFYNLDNGRPHSQVQDEVDALCEDHQPTFFIGAEAGGYELSTPGYRTRRRPKRIRRDTVERRQRIEARRNIVILIRRGTFTRPSRRIDLTATWRRTKFPQLGTHEPRTFPAWRWARTEWIAPHQAPPNIPNREQAQLEGVFAMIKRTQSQKHAVLVGDWNARRGDKTGPSVVADAIAGQVVGHRIDAAVVKGWHVLSSRYVETAGGQPLKSDHGHAFVIKLVKK